MYHFETLKTYQTICIFQNPFDTYTIKPDAATGIREKYPILIPATENSRMVGCLCEYDLKKLYGLNLIKEKLVNANVVITSNLSNMTRWTWVFRLNLAKVKAQE